MYCGIVFSVIQGLCCLTWAELQPRFAGRVPLLQAHEPPRKNSETQHSLVTVDHRITSVPLAAIIAWGIDIYGMHGPRHLTGDVWAFPHLETGFAEARRLQHRAVYSLLLHHIVHSDTGTCLEIHKIYVDYQAVACTPGPTEEHTSQAEYGDFSGGMEADSDVVPYTERATCCSRIIYRRVRAWHLETRISSPYDESMGRPYAYGCRGAPYSAWMLTAVTILLYIIYSNVHE